ncbi:MAG: hypothetical protein K8R64_06770 [Methanosarcinaceae archaeon]|nr:hypothetical protein [Methanosarcinaceae archaeon]
MDGAMNMAVGMNGIRTAGDLVMRMQMNGMKLADAKKYVGDKLGGLDPFELADEYIMKEVREELGFGTINAVPGAIKGIQAKANIAKTLDIEIPCVDVLYNR